MKNRRHRTTTPPNNQADIILAAALLIAWAAFLTGIWTATGTAGATIYLSGTFMGLGIMWAREDLK